MTIREFNNLCTAKKVASSSMPPHTVPPCKYKESSANELTKAVIAYLKHHGAQAERISIEGRVIDKRKTYTDVLGVTRTIGSVDRIKSSGKTGSADVSATFPVMIAGHRVGLSLKIEIKFRKDTQSDKQKEYQYTIEDSGGRYYIVKCFADIVQIVKSIQDEYDQPALPPLR